MVVVGVDATVCLLPPSFGAPLVTAILWRISWTAWSSSASATVGDVLGRSCKKDRRLEEERLEVDK
jgi:hypothetical protein